MEMYGLEIFIAATFRVEVLACRENQHLKSWNFTGIEHRYLTPINLNKAGDRPLRSPSISLENVFSYVYLVI